MKLKNEQIIKTLKAHAARYDLKFSYQEFPSKALMFDIRLKSKLIVVQIHQQEFGISLIDGEVEFTSAADEHLSSLEHMENRLDEMITQHLESN